MKKIAKLLLALLVTSNLGFSASAIQLSEQESPVTAEQTIGEIFLEAAINSNEAIELGKSAIFDASISFTDDNPANIFEWDFGDGNKNQGIEVLHAYKDPKAKTVSLTITTPEGLRSTATKDVFVYKRLFSLITDDDDSRNAIEFSNEIAKDKGIFIEQIDSFGSSTEFISEEILSKKISSKSELMLKSDTIILWTKENTGLNALSRFHQGSSDETKAVLKDKNIVVVTSNIKKNLSRIQRQYTIINPRSITIVEQPAISELLSSESHEDFLSSLEEKNYNFTEVNETFTQLRPWNFMSYFVNTMINQGIPDNTIALLLLLPVIVTVVAIMRQLIGITTFGVYTPAIITLSFLVIGIYAGLLTLIAAILVGSVARPILKKLHILFIPKMSIVITLVSLTLFLIITFSLYLNLFDTAFLSIAIFPMLILSTLVEKFVSAKSDKSLLSAITLMGETLIVSIIAYIIAGGQLDLGFTTIQIDFFKQLMLNVPELIILLLFFNYGLGKWTGLRVLERFRFKEILRHIQE